MGKNKKMNRVIKSLEKYSPDLTIREVRELIKKADIIKSSEEEKLIETIKDKFRWVYLKSLEDSDVYGKELIILHVYGIISHEKSMDWENLFHVRGHKISFSERSLFSRSLTEQSNDFFSEKSLMEMEFISKDDYDFYLDKYREINDKLNSLLK